MEKVNLQIFDNIPKRVDFSLFSCRENIVNLLTIRAKRHSVRPQFAPGSGLIRLQFGFLKFHFEAAITYSNAFLAYFCPKRST